MSSTRILIATQDSIVSALIAALVELEGFEPQFIDASAIASLGVPVRAVVLDVESALLLDCTLPDNVEVSIIVGPASRQDELADCAARLGAAVVHVPAKRGSLREALGAAVR